MDNKVDRKRDIARQHVKERDYEGGYPKEIKMGEILMPPYHGLQMTKVPLVRKSWLGNTINERRPVNTKKRKSRQYH